MRLSRLLGNTLHQAPADSELVSHKLLIRAGMIRQLAAGIYTYLPLGWQVILKIAQIMREEMNRIGGQELLMPVLNPAELWQESGRWFEIGPELVRFKDRSDHDFALAMTHEEVVTDLARRETRSYRQLPYMVYQIQTKIRDEPRARGGLIRVREFLMKDAYSFHADSGDLDRYYPSVYEAYLKIFNRCGLEPVVVEADPGMMGGSDSHEFMALADSGEDTLVLCSNCGYAANIQVAVADKGKAFDGKEAELPIEEVSTPGIKTIEDLTRFLQVSPSHCLKSVIYSVDGKLTLALIRGDLEINETKLTNALRTSSLRLASSEELAAAGIPAGFVSPVGNPRIRVVMDDSVESARNVVAGGNTPDIHLKNVNHPRDFQGDTITDIATVRAGDSCRRCGHPLEIKRGIEVGHTFKLGTKYCEAFEAAYKDRDGKAKPIVMGCYGIGLGRLMATIVETLHDERGIIWPLSVAPATIHLVVLTGEDESIIAEAEKLYEELLAAGCEVLYDDRDESPGVKFNDADLIGIPLRLTISRRTLGKEGVELKLRWEKDSRLVPRPSVIEETRSWLAKAARHPARAFG